MKRRVEFKKYQAYAMGLSLAALTACGPMTSAPILRAASVTEKENILDVKSYRTTFSGLNSDLPADISGHALIKFQDNQMITEVEMEGVAPETLHAQNIRSGSRCPTMADDTNNDGFIDAIEGEAVYGTIHKALTEYPSANAAGAYFYSETVDVEAEENLNGKVIVIEGVSSDAELPETVVGSGESSAQMSLPIACGVLAMEGDTPTDEPGQPQDPIEPQTPQQQQQDQQQQHPQQQQRPTQWQQQPQPQPISDLSDTQGEVETESDEISDEIEIEIESDF